MTYLVITTNKIVNKINNAIFSYNEFVYIKNIKTTAKFL